MRDDFEDAVNNDDDFDMMMIECCEEGLLSIMVLSQMAHGVFKDSPYIPSPVSGATPLNVYAIALGMAKQNIANGEGFFHPTEGLEVASPTEHNAWPLYVRDAILSSLDLDPEGKKADLEYSIFDEAADGKEYETLRSRLTDVILNVEEHYATALVNELNRALNVSAGATPEAYKMALHIAGNEGIDTSQDVKKWLVPCVEQAFFQLSASNTDPFQKLTLQ